jgi:hypothetical protein
MKKIVSILLTLAMVLSLVPAVFAADEPTITMSADKTSVAPGETVTLTLSIDQKVAIGGAAFEITYNSDAYTYEGAVSETYEDVDNFMSTDKGKETINDDGTAVTKVAFLALSKAFNLKAGEICQFKFTAKEANANAMSFSLKVQTLKTFGAEPTDIAHKVVDGELTIPVGTAAAKGYTVSLGADKQVASGQIVEIPVAIGNNDGKTTYSAYDMTFSFDPTILTLNMEATNIEGYRVIPGSGTVRIVRYGKAAELGDALTLSFVAAGQGKSDVKVTEACVDTNANAIEFDAPAAAILDDTAVITVSGYTVDLSDDFTRTDAEGSVIEAGGNLTFVPKDPNYDYTVTVTVGGEEVTPTIGEDGTYTVPNVNGNVVVKSEKTPKSFNVTLGDDTTGETTATYTKDYTFKLTPVDGYVYNVAVTIGGTAYTGFTANVNDDGTTTYTIPGADVTGDIVINSNKTEKQPETFTVKFEGTGAGDAKGESTVQEKTDYTFTVDKKANFEYTITATMGGKDVTVTEGANNTYTISNVTGDLVITIEKKSTLTMEVAVSEYVQMDNKTVFLVTVTGTPEEGKAFAYGEDVMYKTTAYGENVYSWLVIVNKGETFDKATAAAKITQASATAEEVTQSYDVNETNLVDINDAQLTYDIYSGKYTDFEKVSVRKFLRADVTSDKVVNSADAVAVIANSK